MLRTIFAIGFRPFFLAAGWFAAAVILVWLSFLLRGTPPLGGLQPILWHGHQMLYGLAAGVIAGFLLTAAQNWTGLPSTTPSSLGVLFLLWLTARVGFLVPDVVPLWLTSTADLAFFPMLAWLMARVLWRAGTATTTFSCPCWPDSPYSILQSTWSSMAWSAASGCLPCKPPSTWSRPCWCSWLAVSSPSSRPAACPS